MLSLAQFKRDAASGKMSLELVERYGETGDKISEKMRGIRKLSKINTVEATLINADGSESALRFSSTALMEYDGDTLSVYLPGYRKPTEQESAVLLGYETAKKEYMEKNKYGDFYWMGKKYFRESPCPWMDGENRIKGKRYDRYKKLVSDNAVKGEVILKYKVFME